MGSSTLGEGTHWGQPQCRRRKPFLTLGKEESSSLRPHTCCGVNVLEEMLRDSGCPPPPHGRKETQKGARD